MVNLVHTASGLSFGEAEEVRLAKALDAATWASWYDRYYLLLHRYALVRLGNRHGAEDVASQAFLQALRGIRGYSYRGRPVLAWLYRITQNLVAENARQKKRVQTMDTADMELLGFTDGPESSLPDIELRSALARLKSEQRDVILLRFLLGLSARDTGALLGKSEAATYSLQARAVLNLRKVLGQ